MASKYYQAEELKRLQGIYGVCAEEGCDEPVAGWCGECEDEGKAQRFCFDHLDLHLARNGHMTIMTSADRGKPREMHGSGI